MLINVVLALAIVLGAGGLAINLIALVKECVKWLRM
jgi:hypothetical protein